ncbi:MAG: right-handed parallel beta-helix repeat-containing protein [Lentisphaeria bacterium]|nr:right-handed parallel beta-helix repeat-containing protein [Lentisphaeria bacterium]
MRDHALRALGTIVFACGIVTAGAAEFHVAPDGSDDAPGTKNKPFATLTRARDAARKLHGPNGLQEPVTIRLRGGDYFLERPLRLTPEDSGTALHPVRYEAEAGETPILSGGIPITGWRRTNDGRWTVALDDVKTGTLYFHQLFSRRRGQSWFERRYRPSRGLRIIAGLTDAPHKNPTGRVNHRNPQKEVLFRPGDIERWQNLPDVELLFTHDWSSGRMHIDGVDFDQEIVRFREFPHYRIGHWYPGGRNPYLVENVKEWIGEPGEWYLDRSAGTLTYTPLADEDIRTTEFVAPRLERLVLIEGDYSVGDYVEHIQFHGITFAHSAWHLPPHLYAEKYKRGCRQGFVDMPSAVEFKSARHCRVERCTFANLGSYGVDLADGCHENEIVGNLMYDLGTGGVKVGTVDRSATEPRLPTDNRICNNVVSSSGVAHYSGHGIWGGMCARTIISNNVVTRTLYSAIAVGWSHSKTASACRENVMERNHVYDVMLLLDHGGALYTLGNQPGTIIRGNLIHDTYRTKLHGEVKRPVWVSGALAFDDGSSDFTVEDNILYNTPNDPALALTSKRAKDMNIGKNYCGIRPGDDGFPADLAAKAGLEPPFRDLLKVPFKAIDPPILAMKLPTGLKPAKIVDTFERIPVGGHSRLAYCRIEDKAPGKGTDEMAVTEETAGAGKRALKIVDAPGLSQPWIPYVSYSPRYASGIARAECMLRLEPGAMLEYCWRGRHPKAEFSVGPSFKFKDGMLHVPEHDPLPIPPSQWIGLTVRARLGEFDPGIGREGAKEHGIWSLEVRLPNGEIRTYRQLKHANPEFKELTSVMFISTATKTATVYLDEVRISVE